MLSSLHALVLPLAPKGPAPEEVTAGWLGFVVFIGLGLAVVVLAFSLVKHLRRAQAAKDAGVYGDEPVAEPTEPTEEPGPEARPQA